MCWKWKSRLPRVPDHELIRPIGEGSYGAVWLARNIMGAWRAVKVVYRDDFNDDRPFQREFNGIQKFEPISRSHDGFVDVLQVGRDEQAGYFYYVMELADDTVAAPAEFKAETYAPKTLRFERDRCGRLPVEECAQIGLSLASALEHLHLNGLVHRDIKPSNIIFVHGLPKLADIGLVAEVNEARSFVGTEGFIPPEGPGTAQADIYSLGKVLYEISSGKDRHAFPEPPTRLGEFKDAAELLELDEVIQRACESDPHRRYSSAQQLHDDLLLLQAGQSVRQLHITQRRLAVATRIGIAAGIIALLALGGYLFAQHQARQAQEQSRREAQLRQAAEASEQKAKTEGIKAQQVSKFLQDMIENVNPRTAMGADTTLFRQILDRARNRVGRDLKEYPEAQAEILTRIGRVYSGLGQNDQAEVMLRDAVALHRKVRGNEHELVADALNHLSGVLQSQGKLAEAEPVVREALAIQRKLLGDEHPYTANGLGQLAGVLTWQGRLAEAETTMRAALAIRRNHQTNNPRAAANSLNALAGVLSLQGKRQEAESVAYEGIALWRRIHDQGSPNQASSIHHLASILLRHGKSAEAETAAREALAMQRKFLEPNHPEVLTSLDTLAKTLGVQGKLAEAETFARESLALREQSAPDDWQTFNQRSRLAAILLEQKKYAEAEPLLLTAYDGLKQREVKIPAKGKTSLKDAAQRLVQLYESMNCPDEAAEWKRKLAKPDAGQTKNVVSVSEAQK